VAENQPSKKYRMNHELANFAGRLRRAIQSGFDPEQFAPLALELFRHQYQHNDPYRKFCDRQGVGPAAPCDWARIPAMPTTAFKYLELSCLSAPERTAVFHSSGTTGQPAGSHYHGAESLLVYETSLWQWFTSNWGKVEGLLVLTPGPKAARHSSLVHMFDTIRQRGGFPETVFTGVIPPDGTWQLDFPAVLEALRQAVRAGTPLNLLGTAFSFVHLLDDLAKLNRHFELPFGSQVLETGGYKNRSRELPKAELHAWISRQLGIRADNIICEYGMSELSSQAYATARKSGLDGVFHLRQEGGAGQAPHWGGAKPAFHFPPWARARIISPETGEEVQEGETGLIRLFDLANVFSVAAIQTEDLGIRRGGGFELLGRAPLAEPRGCSLLTV
jgi:hypothetical protein